MNSFIITDLARTTIAQRRAEAAAYNRAKLARRAFTKATHFITRVTNRPLVPAQRGPQSGQQQPEFVGGGRVRG